METVGKIEGITSKKITKYKQGVGREVTDILAIEAPLEIQIQKFMEEKPKSISVTMRTPGDDEELALGFLFTEGIISGYEAIKAVSYNGDNIVKIYLNKGFDYNLGNAERNFYTTSSCGVCGKASIESIQCKSNFIISRPTVSNEVILGLRSQLDEHQTLFSSTGGIHAAAVFSLQGKLLHLREDVGRHNALDKLIGFSLKNDLIPLKDSILLLSGRASFELIQKATMAGMGFIAAVGAPSSLAVELAQSNNQTLVGFLKDDGYNVYTS